MRFSTSAVAGLVAVAAANSSYPAASWTTEVVTAYTTYCPEATVITHGASTYSVTAATTLTISGPVTVTKPASTSVVTVCSACYTTPSKPTWSPAPSVGTASAYKPSNGTATTWAAPSTYSAPAATTSAPASYKGDASKASFGVAGLIAAVGLVAAL